MIVDKGLNDRWPKRHRPTKQKDGSYRVRLTEPFGKTWQETLVSYPLPQALADAPVSVTLADKAVACQKADGQIYIAVDNLQPNESREYQLAARRSKNAGNGVSMETGKQYVTLGNEQLSLRLPASQRVSAKKTGPVPGPICAVSRGNGWFGSGRLQSAEPVTRIKTTKTNVGSLWTEVTVSYQFRSGAEYRCQIRLRPNSDFVHVSEHSTLPLRLWPDERPYREIGTLNPSHWDQDIETIARAGTRPCPSSNFVFDVGRDANRLQTHSTAAWEIMDMPLGSAVPKAYTAMRASYPAIDAGWLAVYHSDGDLMVGAASVNLAGWQLPDDAVHPVHRTPGAHAEVPFMDGPDGCHFRFPIENVTRHWLMVVAPTGGWNGVSDHGGKPGKACCVTASPTHPVWQRRNQEGDLALNKVKDWILDWPDGGSRHPRVLCNASGFKRMRRNVAVVPELKALHEQTREMRSVDRFVLEGERSGLAPIEACTGASLRLQDILDKGYIGPNYAIAIARPLRRYALACDMQWSCLSKAERKEARRVCALAAYILSDGDWWQYAYRPGETTYLPNFNTDVYACYGLIGMFLDDHPCAKQWQQGALKRMKLELPMYLRRDGGGEENVGGYYMSTWTQLYMPLMWAFRHCGLHDFSKDPNVLAAARFLTRLIGPADARENGTRLFPPIGHHPHVLKVFPFISWLASFIRQSDPALASELMWLWQQNGKPVGNNYDHSGPAANAFTRHYLFHDPDVQPQGPPMGSHALPHVGAVLRSDSAERAGSYLFLKAGRVHSHHDDDEGSFHYFGRGVPLALDGLLMNNGATVHEHNVISFPRPGQPTAVVEAFHSSAHVDYVRAEARPRAYSCDAMYLEDTHRSGFTRELVMVKSPQADGVEYIVVKDTAVGPDPAQWNLDVLSKRPRQRGNAVFFPGHPELGMGLDVHILEPSAPEIQIEKGKVRKELMSAKGRKKLQARDAKWTILEHWLMHIPSTAGATFLAVLFPRKPKEATATVEYLEREETIRVRHQDGEDVIFLRPNPMVGTSLAGVRFQGRAGAAIGRGDDVVLAALDGTISPSLPNENLWKAL